MKDPNPLTQYLRGQDHEPCLETNVNVAQKVILWLANTPDTHNVLDHRLDESSLYGVGVEARDRDAAAVYLLNRGNDQYRHDDADPTRLIVSCPYLFGLT